MEFFDTHFHLPDEITTSEFLTESEDAVKLATETAKISGEKIFLRMLAAGADFPESVRAAEFAKQSGNCFSCGVHPHHAAEYRKNSENFAIFKDMPALAAIGEIGLDYFYDDSPRTIQNDVFGEFLDLALAWRVPAMLHLRDQLTATGAYTDALKLLEPFVRSGGTFVIHCCTAPLAVLDEFLALGAMIGVTGMITFRGASDVREMLSHVPAERLLIETDSPYLAPIPFRGKPNNPGLVILTAARLAEERGMTLQEMAELTAANGRKFYNIENGAAE